MYRFDAMRAGIAALILAGGMIAAGGFTARVAPSLPVYRPPVDLGTVNPASTFALVASVYVDGRGERYTVDRDLTRDDCRATADWPIAALSDIGVRIALETAGSIEGFALACVEERQA